MSLHTIRRIASVPEVISPLEDTMKSKDPVFNPNKQDTRLKVISVDRAEAYTVLGGAAGSLSVGRQHLAS